MAAGYTDKEKGGKDLDLCPHPYGKIALFSYKL